MTQIVDLMLDGKRYKVVFPHDAPPRAYLMIRRRQNDPHFMSVREPERYDRVVEAARRTLTDPATQNIPTEKSATQWTPPGSLAKTGAGRRADQPRDGRQAQWTQTHACQRFRSPTNVVNYSQQEPRPGGRGEGAQAGSGLLKPFAKGDRKDAYRQACLAAAVCSIPDREAQ
jgi:hypothetical protein